MAMIQIHVVDVIAAAVVVDAVAVSHKAMNLIPTRIHKKAKSQQKVQQRMAARVAHIAAVAAAAQAEMALHLVRSSMKMA
jgi:hypothetical protein